MPLTILQANQVSYIGASGTLVSDEELKANPNRLDLRGDNNTGNAGRIYGIPYISLSSLGSQYINWALIAPDGASVLTLDWMFTMAKNVDGTVAFEVEVNEMVVGKFLSEQNILSEWATEERSWEQDRVYNLSAFVDLSSFVQPIKMISVSLIRQGAYDTSNTASRIIAATVHY